MFIRCFGLLLQMQNALKRGIAYGILKKTDGHYSLPTDNEVARQEVAVQEIGLLDLYCQRKIHRSRGGRARRNRGTGRSRRVACRCSKRGARQRSRECGSRSCRRRRRDRDFERPVHDETTRPRIEPILDADKLTDKSTRSNQTTTEATNVIGSIEQGSRSNMPSEQWDYSIPLSC